MVARISSLEAPDRLQMSLRCSPQSAYVKVSFFSSCLPSLRLFSSPIRISHLACTKMDATMYEKDSKGHADGMQKTVSRTQVIEHASKRIDLHSNVGAKLRNPLAGVPREVLMADVEAFVAEKGLENHLPAFKKGALLAQHPVSQPL